MMSPAYDPAVTSHDNEQPSWTQVTNPLVFLATANLKPRLHGRSFSSTHKRRPRPRIASPSHRASGSGKPTTDPQMEPSAGLGAMPLPVHGYSPRGMDIDSNCANCRWCAPKQVSIKVNFLVFGSYIAAWRPELSSGNNFAEGLSDLLAHPLCGYGSDLDLHSSIEIYESNISLELRRHLVDAGF